MTETQKILTQSIQEACKTLGAASPRAIHLEHPSNPAFGDYSSTIAMEIFSQVKNGTWKSPRDLAVALAGQLHHEPFSEVSVAGPGFLNFTLTDTYLLEHMGTLDIPQVGEGKKVIVEYSSPNIAKPFTVGHLRSTIIGDAIANLHDVTGFTVFRDNHLGDWGTQFGKLIAAIKRWPDDFKKIEAATTPVKVLVDLYIKFHAEAEKDSTLEDEGRAWFKKLEDGDKEARGLWQQCVDWSWKEFDRIYRELEINVSKFENNGRGYGESYFEDKMQPVIDELKTKELLAEGKEGAKIIEFSESLKLPPLMILKRDGATLYATRDLATDKWRLKEYGKDLTIINEVGIEQALYFQQLYTVEEILGWYKKGQRIHIKHGHYRFKEGKMSTRKGNVIWLEDVLKEAIQRAADLALEKSIEPDVFVKNDKPSGGSRIKNFHIIGGKDRRDEVTKQVGIGALKWNDLKRSSHLDVTFDWDDILNMQGNSGPYIQYTAVRCKSVLHKSTAGKKATATKITNAEERAISVKLLEFPEVIQKSVIEYAPHYICTYLYELAQIFNTFYNQHKIIGSENEQLRLQLTTDVAATLTKGLTILGISVPENM